MDKKEHQIEIWFFIGAILTFYGFVILGAGIYHLFEPPTRRVALQHLHADIWWPVVLVVVGVYYAVRFAPWRRDRD